MAAISSVFDLFGEHDKYQVYLPAAVFAYLYHLSNQTAYILTGVFFIAIATGIVEAEKKKTRKIRAGEGRESLSPRDVRDIYTSNWLEIFIILLSLINSIGYLLAATAGWNNVTQEPKLRRFTP